jgi:formylmethanofuran dehydrogenase subunit C
MCGGPEECAGGERPSGRILAETNIRAFTGIVMDNGAIISTFIRFCQTIVVFLA